MTHSVVVVETELIYMTYLCTYVCSSDGSGNTRNYLAKKWVLRQFEQGFFFQFLPNFK